MRKKMNPYDRFQETINPLMKNGIILVSGSEGNPMTIGWGSMGYYWTKPVFTIVVRPSRYSYGLLKNEPEFSVNIMAQDYKKEVAYCGSHSGREVDKIRVCKWELSPGHEIKIPYIVQSLFHYECRILNHADFHKEDMDSEISERFYPQNDFHRVFYGEILGLYEV